MERSAAAISYSGELLGMLAIHLFLLAVEESHKTTDGRSEVHCDNKGALFTFEREEKHVLSRAKNADIQRVLRRVNGQMRGNYSTHHVKAHQDNHKHRSQLTLASHLNCVYDKLAKDAVNEAALAVNEAGIMEIEITANLPMELASLYIGNSKQTSDVAKDLDHPLH